MPGGGAAAARSSSTPAPSRVVALDDDGRVRAGPAVPARRSARACASCRPACSTSRRARRRTAAARAGRGGRLTAAPWDAAGRRAHLARAAPTRRSGCSWPATSPRCPRTTGTSASDEEADLERAPGAAGRGGRDGARRRDRQRAAVAGLLAAACARDRPWAPLRPPTHLAAAARPAPWPRLGRRSRAASHSAEPRGRTAGRSGQRGDRPLRGCTRLEQCASAVPGSRCTPAPRHQRPRPERQRSPARRTPPARCAEHGVAVSSGRPRLRRRQAGCSRSDRAHGAGGPTCGSYGTSAAATCARCLGAAAPGDLARGPPPCAALSRRERGARPSSGVGCRPPPDVGGAAGTPVGLVPGPADPVQQVTRVAGRPGQAVRSPDGCSA